MNKHTGLSSVLVVLSLLVPSCSGGEREPIPTPTPDYALPVAQACLGFLDDMKDQGWFTSKVTAQDEAIILNTCISEMPLFIQQENRNQWPDEDTAFRAGQRVVGRADANGAYIDDWRGHDLANLLAKNILEVNK